MGEGSEEHLSVPLFSLRNTNGTQAGHKGDIEASGHRFTLFSIPSPLEVRRATSILLFKRL